MKQIKSDQKVVMLEPAVEFKGYTMEELRHQRALLAVRKEFCKAQLNESFNALRPGRGKGKGKNSSKWAIAGKVASKVFSNLNVLDYALMGVSVFSTLRRGLKRKNKQISCKKK